MLRKILKMFKESNILKAHVGLIILGVVLHVVWDKDVAYTVIIPTLLLCCTIVGRLLIDRKYDRIKKEWAEGAIDEHERYVMLEADAAKRCPEYLHLHKMMKDKMEEMGVHYEDHLHPTWLCTFKIWMYALAKQYETFEITDIQVAAAIMNTLISPADSDEHIKIIFECIKDLIKAPKKYECRFDRDSVTLIDTGIIMPTSDPDEYIALKGEGEFIECIKMAANSRESADAEMTVCGIFYDMYYLTKSF